MADSFSLLFVTIAMRILLFGSVLFLATASSTPAANNDPCANGTCPTPSTFTAVEEDQPCGLWLGPSPIKQHEEHGFGLGMFTGKAIKKGEAVDEGLLIPLYDWDDQHHPPLREYLWNGGNVLDLSLMSLEGAFYFLPGLGSIVPCTSENYNLENFRQYEELPENPSSPTFGSRSNYRNKWFRAVRDISPGEELTVECSDDNFDGGTYYLSRYTPNKDNQSEIMCLDDNLEVRESHIPDAGLGAFSKRNLTDGQVLLSTPVVQIDRKELRVKEDIINEYGVPEQHVMLNYCFGHPNSQLLLLPNAPISNYFNHDSVKVNAKITWHSSKEFSKPLGQRQEHHHPELLELAAEVVAELHGKGLMLDIVATRDIEPGEEIYLDYGKDWVNAWEKHKKGWKATNPGYTTALQYERILEEAESPFTESEIIGDQNYSILRDPKEQLRHPYPPNIMFACWHSHTWQDPDQDASWIQHDFEDYEGQELRCLTPCTIEARYNRNPETKEADDDEGSADSEEESSEAEGAILYRVKLVEVDENSDIEWECQLAPDVEYEYTNLPREFISAIDRPYTSSASQSNAFRHEMGVPDGLYPDAWLEKKVRRRMADNPSDYNLEHFKRKSPRNPVEKKRTSLTASSL